MSSMGHVQSALKALSRSSHHLEKEQATADTALETMMGLLRIIANRPAMFTRMTSHISHVMCLVGTCLMSLAAHSGKRALLQNPKFVDFEEVLTMYSAATVTHYISACHSL